MTMSDTLAVRDALMARQVAYRDLANAGTLTASRYSKSEIKYVSAIDIAATQRQADDFARQHRELDARIQEVNWTTDLGEWAPAFGSR